MLNNGYSVYGNYRTRTFADIFPSAEEFSKVYTENGIPTTISNSNLTTLYYLLYAKYGNSSIASSDENQFKYKVFATVFQYGPTWEKRLDIQEKLRGLTDNELFYGAKAIYNSALNPSTGPVQEEDGKPVELTFINSQNTTTYKKSKLDAYSILMELLKTDVTGEFLTKFKKLFIQIVNPELPLWYGTKEEETEQGDVIL